MMSTSTFGAIADTTHPINSVNRLTSTIRRLPYMSPSRPSTGLATAPVRNAAVATHDTLLTDVCSSSGRTGRSGNETVCVIETSAPQYPSTAMIAVLLAVARFVIA